MSGPYQLMPARVFRLGVQFAWPMPPHDDARPLLDPSVAKHLQIAKHFRERIKSGDLAQGDKLASERLIAETFRVSRPTATRAIATLRQWGVVTSQPGLGTFVRHAAVSATANDTDLADLDTRLNRTEQRLAELPDDTAARIDQLARSLGILQAQVLELYEHTLGLERAPSKPRQATNDS